MPQDPAAALSPEDLAAVLPGTWRVQATNFPMWLSGERHSPTFTYELVSPDPLVLSDDVCWFDGDGAEQHVLGVDRFTAHGFLWRGRRLLSLFTSRWTVSGVSDDNDVVVIRFEKSLATPAGIDVIVRSDADVPEARALVARSAASFGLSAEDFASLAWLTPAGTH